MRKTTVLLTVAEPVPGFVAAIAGVIPVAQ
jgi:hypothetical protein